MRLDKEDPLYDRLYTEFLRISRQLENLEAKRGKEFRDMLFAYLKNEINGYYGMIEFWGHPDDLDFGDESANDLLHRDCLEILLMELKKDHDLSGYEAQVYNMDRLFKQKFAENIERTLERCPYLEDPLAPDNFWWRHPSKIFSEKQARMKQ